MVEVVRSSIFNSSKITNSLIIFIGVFVCYNIYLIVIKPPVAFYQNQWQNNFSRAQDYVYYSNAERVIVGSSMANRMEDGLLPDKYFNLALSGGSALTGLEIIKRSGRLPSKIYVEGNLIFKNKDDEMIHQLFLPFTFHLKRLVPALQEKNQPINVLVSLIKNQYIAQHKEQVKEFVNNDIFVAQLAQSREFYLSPPTGYLNELRELVELVNYFELEGVSIYFFEMPIAPELANLTRSLEQRRIIKSLFNNEWLPYPDNGEYQTTDGIHLTYASAHRFSQHFTAGADKLDTIDSN